MNEHFFNIEVVRGVFMSFIRNKGQTKYIFYSNNANLAAWCSRCKVRMVAYQDIQDVAKSAREFLLNPEQL